MGDWTAILLAGERPGESGFARSLGVSAKALIPVAGEPMLARVARALLAAPSVGRILVLAQAPAAAPFRGARMAFQGAEDRLGRFGRRRSRPASAPWPEARRRHGRCWSPPPIMPCSRRRSSRPSSPTADGADVAFAMVERRVVEAAWPETKRTWLKARGGQYSGANLFALANAKAGAALALWSGIERDRKKALAPARLSRPSYPDRRSHPHPHPAGGGDADRPQARARRQGGGPALCGSGDRRRQARGSRACRTHPRCALADRESCLRRRHRGVRPEIRRSQDPRLCSDTQNRPRWQ